MSSHYDVIILGAGAAGMMCAIQAGKRGRKVLILDHAQRLGGKILISGGGRCNFTNLEAGPANYVSQNPHFCKSALSRYPSESFIQMVRDHHVPFHEKKLGQLFCDGSAKSIVSLLQTECDQVGIEIQLGQKVSRISKAEKEGQSLFFVESLSGTLGRKLSCESLVVATGGLSIPKLGATGFGYEIATQFGIGLVERAPALDGFIFSDLETDFFTSLAGLSIDCSISCNGLSFRENILFTHSGLSGPAALQASLHWRRGDPVMINLLPDLSAFEWFLKQKRSGSRALVKNLLTELLPSRFATQFCDRYFSSQNSQQLPLIQTSEKALEDFCHQIHAWVLTPVRTVGYSKAEVTRGGVDTHELSSKTMEATKVPGLYFVGEVVDVTGWLGGYNFQWAWASGWAAGQAV